MGTTGLILGIAGIVGCIGCAAMIPVVCKRYQKKRAALLKQIENEDI